MTRVLVTGAGGLLAAAIVREFSSAWDVRPVAHAALDITSAAAVSETVGQAAPDLIVNCAAQSGVDAAQDDAAGALAVNAFGVRTLARAAAQRGCAFVHFSSDFVFDGEATRPYVEEDDTHPRSVYGLSKLLGEWFAVENPRTFVLRVESLFGEPAPGRPPRGSVHAIVTGIDAGAEVPVFVDRTVSPTSTADVARATRALVERGLPYGLYHCVNSGAATWLEVAEEAARLLDRPLRVRPMTLESAGLRAPRPRYCALSNAKLAAAGVAMPPWQDALARHLAIA